MADVERSWFRSSRIRTGPADDGRAGQLRKLTGSPR